MVSQGSSGILTTYLIEDNLLNGRVHYTSEDGKDTLTYVKGHWSIQDERHRCYLITLKYGIALSFNSFHVYNNKLGKSTCNLRVPGRNRQHMEVL